jgi:acyl-CoA synthetase (AMP-forming)/AMP-acid ligase II
MVGLSIADEVTHLLATLAIQATGAGQIVLATHDTLLQRSCLAGRVGVTHVISSSNSHRIPEIKYVTWPHLVTAATCLLQQRCELGATVCLRTSGTTGDLNVVVFTEGQIAAQAEQHSDYSGERFLRFASIEHNNSKRHRLYCLWRGGTNVFRPPGNFDIGAFVNRYGVTSLDISRLHAADLTAPECARKLEKVKLTASGSALPFDLRHNIQCMVTNNLYVRYAATECGTVAVAHPNQHDLDETAGAPLSGVDLQIVNADDVVLPAGQLGEIRVRTPGMATGYHDSPGDEERRFRLGWFYPGDMGSLREDGQLIVHGRRDDMIILNGINIFPAEIERILESHPFVGAAAALPLASHVHGQIPVAAVELRPGREIDVSSLQLFARQHLSLRAPRRIVVMSKLPRNSQGKILKREIKAAFLPGSVERD